jgi:hypothetical protein
MYQLKRAGQVRYEDLMRELEVIEKKLFKVDGSLAMNLMVLEAKIRERFQKMEDDSTVPPLSLDDIQALIPQDLPALPTLAELEPSRRRKKMWETMGTAAALAVFTAMGVFGFASVLQIALTWLA